AEDGIRDRNVTGVQTCALPICGPLRVAFIMYASIIVSVSASDVNKVFEYRIPDGLTDFIAVGHRVLVPFGPRQIQGYVIDIKDEVGYDPSKIKPINHAMDVQPV